MPQKIFNSQTGEEKLVDSVDAREHVNTGRWSYVPTEPTVESATQESATQEAYEERKAIFEQSTDPEKVEQAAAIVTEISKSKARKTK